MNVIGCRPDGWWRDRHAAMLGLVDRLEAWAAAGGHRVTVVFERPPAPPIRSAVIEIAAAPRPGADSADDEIARLVRADACPGQITVVTSDIGLAQRIQRAGAAVHPASRFRDLLEQTTGQPR